MRPGLRVIAAFICLLAAGGFLALSLRGGSGRPRMPSAAEAAQTARLVPVMVAGRAVVRGTVITQADVASSRIEAPAPALAVTIPGSITGSIALRDVAQGQIFLASDIDKVTVGSGLAALIPDGMRAVALRVDDEVAVGYFVAPGDHVDVKWITADAKGAAARDLLDDILVLSAGDTLAAQPLATARRMQTVTLAVTPADARKLAAAKETGHFYLALRRPGDTQALAAGTISTDTLLSRAARVPSPDGARRLTVISGASQGYLAVENR